MKDNIADLRPNPWLRPRNLFLGATVLIVALLISTITVYGDAESIAALIEELRDRGFAVSEASNPPPGDPSDPWSKWVLDQQPCGNTLFLHAAAPAQVAFEAASSVGTVIVGSFSSSSVYVLKAVEGGYEVTFLVTRGVRGFSNVHFISSDDVLLRGGKARSSLNMLRLSRTNRFDPNIDKSGMFSQITGNPCH